MRREASERVVAKIGSKLDEDGTFMATAFVWDVRAGAFNVIHQHELDAEEAAVNLEMASRVSPIWYARRRRARRRERDRSRLSA